VLGCYFLYVTVMVWCRLGAWTRPATFAFLIAIGLFAIAQLDRVSGRPAWSVLRDWLPALLVLIAYWSVDWAAKPHVDYSLEHALVRWDRLLLNDWGLRAGIERFGAVLPMVLEIAYLSLYAVLPIVIAAFYAGGQRERLDDFLFPFLLGTLTTYALLPHFPSQGPRFAFAGQDLPGFDTLIRRVNVWVLDRGDIRSSVFPSGHVAVAFSSAFAMWLAVPNRRVGWTLFAGALLVWITTVYGRYHYAADGLASLVISAAAIGCIVPARAIAARLRR
jgi:membrane-associated phospholipid phosphatase